MGTKPSQAPGAPGAPAIWNSGAKAGVGTALKPASLVWFTLARGVIEEVFYPRADRPTVRDFGLAVADGGQFFSWEKDDTESDVTTPDRGAPAYQLMNTCRRGRYLIEKHVLTHPDRPAILQQTRFTALSGTAADYGVYAILNVHMGGGAAGWLGDFKGMPVLFAAGGGAALALACSAGWAARTAGFTGPSDAWHDLTEHRQLTRTYDRADGGNITLAGQVAVDGGGEFLLAVGFGLKPNDAALAARAALLDGFAVARERYVGDWEEWQRTIRPLDGGRGDRTAAVYRASTAALRTHEARRPAGAIIASLAVPWGEVHVGPDTGGYHLVWPRDLFEAAGGLLAAGAPERAREIMAYLEATQEPDGHWPQNMWLDGTAYWHGIQLDEAALCVQLVALSRREGALDEAATTRLWRMARKAIGYVVRHGPASPEDRWEQKAGYSPFTLATEVSALVAAADLAAEHGEPALADYLRETADDWNAGIEDWTYVTGTDLAREVGVEGYYVRIAPPDAELGLRPAGGSPADRAAAEVVSPDALALVRFGLRAADDPRIVNTVRVIDARLKVEFPCGPAWRRYTGDRYGEQADGAPFDGKHRAGIGRAWPLLTGERAHYELAAGRPGEAERLLHAMEGLATPTGLIPEQSWDAADIPDKHLFFGRPTGSACPLVWAHAEYLKLLRSLTDGRVFDTPPQTAERYQRGRARARYRNWRFNHPVREMAAGQCLRVEAQAAFHLRWSTDGWKHTHETEATDTGLGVYKADLPTDHLPPGAAVTFTFHWVRAGRWEGKDFRVAVTGPPTRH